MRALLLHSNKFETKVILESNWPKGIEPETKKSPSEELKQCLVCFFCVEEGDSEKQLNDFYQEILKTSDEVKTKNLMIAPFVHLSNKIAKPNIAKKMYLSLMKKFENSDFVVKSSHFGYHKSLLLDIKGHPGSFRYREFY
jgi:threonyl-tRNA synthetase